MNLGTWLPIGRILLIKGTRALQGFGVANSAHGGCFAMPLECKFDWMFMLCQACQETRRKDPAGREKMRSPLRRLDLFVERAPSDSPHIEESTSAI